MRHPYHQMWFILQRSSSLERHIDQRQPQAEKPWRRYEAKIVCRTDYAFFLLLQLSQRLRLIQHTIHSFPLSHRRTMRLATAHALSAVAVLATSAGAQTVAYPTSLVGTWSTKSNKTLTGPVCIIGDVLCALACSLTMPYRHFTTQSTKS